jgi:zinc protease
MPFSVLILLLLLPGILSVGPTTRRQRPPESQNMQVEGPYISREDEGQTTKVVLKNGLTVIVREQFAVALTGITTFVKAGYFDEDDRSSGISHVIEHMLFKGTAKRPVGAIAREIKGLGGYLNAYTYYDRTTYQVVVPAENTAKALDIQADALRNSIFDPAELQREIEVVLQENNRKLDNPSALTSEKLYSIAFQHHRMGRWRIGTVEGLRALTRDDVVGYYNRYYRPSNIILSLVGQFDREEILGEVVKLYGAMEDEPVERDTSPPEPEQVSSRYGWQRGPLEQVHVALGFHAPGVLTDEARALEVLAAILSEGRASVLNQFVRDEKGLITSGTAHLNGFKNLGYFEVDLETNKSIEGQIAVLAEIENIKRNAITDEALARAKALIARKLYHDLETVNGIAEHLAYYEALGDWKNSDAYVSSIEKVTAADVINATKTYLKFENLSAFEYLPASASRALTEEDYQQTVLNKVAAATEQRTFQELPVTTEITVPAESVTHDLIKPIQKRSILRGPDVYILEDHRLPLVSFGIFFPGGRLYESAKNAGVTELMLRTAIRGTQRFNSADISRRLENSGARIQVVNEPDFFGYVVDGLSPKMNEAIGLLMDIIHQPAFQENDVAREKSLQIERIKTLKENNYLYPVHLFMGALYGQHPYARPAEGTEDSVQSLTAEDLAAWFKQNQRQLLPLIIIVGDTQGTGLVAPVTDALTNLDLHERDIASLPFVEPKRESQEAVEEVPRQQTALVYGFPTVNLRNADRFPLVVLENIVSGLGGRFFNTLREKQGLAYTVHTYNRFFVKSGAIFSYTAFSPENESKVRESLQNEIDHVRNDGVTPEEVNQAVAYSVGAHNIGLQSRRARVLEYARAIYSGAGVNSVEEYSAAIRKVSPDQVKTAASRYLDPQVLRVAIVRGATK